MHSDFSLKSTGINTVHGICTVDTLYCSTNSKIWSSQTYSNSMDQPDKVANPARGQLDREDYYFPARVRV